VPIDSIQAASDLIAMKQAGCTKVAVANDKQAYGAGLAKLLETGEGSYGITITSNNGIDPTTPNFRSYASTIQGQGADCFFFAGNLPANGAVQIVKDVNSALPKAKDLSAAMVSARTPGQARRRAASRPAIDPLIPVATVATLDLDLVYRVARTSWPRTRPSTGTANPDPYAIYGYEVMKLGLDYDR